MMTMSAHPKPMPVVLMKLLWAAELAAGSLDRMNQATWLGDDGAAAPSYQRFAVASASVNEALQELGWAALLAFKQGALSLSCPRCTEPQAEVRPAPEFAPQRVSEPPPVGLDLGPAKLAEIQRAMQGGAGELSLPQDPVSAAQSVWADRRTLPEGGGSARTFAQEFSRVRSMLDDESFDAWEPLPGRAKTLLVRFMVAQIEHLKSRPRRLRPTHALGDGAFDALFRTLGEHVGVAELRATRAVGPDGATWLDDARTLRVELDTAFARLPQTMVAAGGAKEEAREERGFNTERALDALRELIDSGAIASAVRRKVVELLDAGLCQTDVRLLGLLADHLDALVGSRLSGLRQKVRKHKKALDAETKRIVPDTWEHADWWAAKRIAIVGGDRLSGVVARLREKIPDAQIDWTETSPGGGHRQIQALVERINYGSVDLVLLVQRFMSHKISASVMAAVKHNPHGAKAEVLVRGYGLTQLLAALERSLSGARGE